MKSLEALIIRTATETDATIKIDASKIARAGLALAKKHGITPSDAVSHVMIGTWKGIASYEAGDATIETWIRTRILGEISHSTDRTKSRKVLSQASELAMTGASEDEASVYQAKDYGSTWPNPEQAAIWKQGLSQLQAELMPAEFELMMGLSEGNTLNSLADAAGVSRQAVMKRTANLRTKLGRNPKVRELRELVAELAPR